jgi:NAD-dependent SIR2 family protein deacetylase
VSQLHGSIWEFAKPRDVDFTEDPLFAEDQKLMQYPEMRDEILQRWSEENRQIIWEDRRVPFANIPPDDDPNVRPNVLLYDESYGSRLLWVEDFISRKPDIILIIGCSGGVGILERLLRSCRLANPKCDIININPHEDFVSMQHDYLALKATVAMMQLDSCLRK